MIGYLLVGVFAAISVAYLVSMLLDDIRSYKAYSKRIEDAKKMDDIKWFK